MSISIATRTGSPAGSRLAHVRAALTGPEWARAFGMVGVIVALHVIGWFTLIAFVAPHHGAGGKSLGIGIGLTAYTLGMRHAFDADHISAIDNTTRKLMNDGQRPLSVGFFFSLGHASVVFALSLLLSLGVKRIVGPVQNDSSSLHHYTGLIGTSVSGSFLYLIAGINIMILAGILKVFRSMRDGSYDEAELEEQLNNRGFMSRIFGGLMKSITQAVPDVRRRVPVRARLRHRDPRSRCWYSPAPARRPGCPGTPSSACRCCSPPA